ncbi:UNVERIFIED_CONTAM: hypothetical protein Cloal_0068 [Acetivibrio alkalicellulosi]
MSKIKIASLAIAIIVLLLIISSYVANVIFDCRVKKEVKEFLSEVEKNSTIIEREDIEGLPLNVQKWLEYSGIIGREKINSVRLIQNADMRLGKDSSWMPVRAEQYFTISNPGFIWKAKINVAPLIHIVGRDKYYEGKGSMIIKPLSLFTLADSSGKEMDQGAMLRYLAEIVWFPTAALEDYITWEEIDNNIAKATMSYGGITASGIFTFNEVGEVIKFEAERYGEFDGEFKLELWSIPIREYKEFDGIKVPTKGDVTWKFKERDFNWYNFELIEIEYNNPIP